METAGYTPGSKQQAAGSMSSKVQSKGRKRGAGAGEGRAIFSLIICPEVALEDSALGTTALPLFFSLESTISPYFPSIGPRAKEQQQASAPESLPPPNANAEAIRFLTSLSEPGQWVSGEEGTSVERREERQPRPGPRLSPH